MPLSRGARQGRGSRARGRRPRNLTTYRCLARAHSCCARPATAPIPSAPLGRRTSPEGRTWHTPGESMGPRGWLDGPELDCGSRRSPSGPAYTALHDSPYGRLIRARAAERRADAAKQRMRWWRRRRLSDGRSRTVNEPRKQGLIGDVSTSTHEEDLVSAKLQLAIEDDTECRRRRQHGDGHHRHRTASEPHVYGPALCEGIDRVRSIHDARVWGLDRRSWPRCGRRSPSGRHSIRSALPWTNRSFTAASLRPSRPSRGKRRADSTPLAQTSGRESGAAGGDRPAGLGNPSDQQKGHPEIDPDAPRGTVTSTRE